MCVLGSIHAGRVPDASTWVAGTRHACTKGPHVDGTTSARSRASVDVSPETTVSGRHFGALPRHPGSSPGCLTVSPTQEAESGELTCVICGRAAQVIADPPRRTLAREPDPADPSYAVIAVLPTMALCDEHANASQRSDLVIGWCDEETCRNYGEVGERSPCGHPYLALKR